MSTIVSPSILAADRNNLLSEIIKAEKAGATFIHIDVMDGVFVPATTFTVDEVGLLTKWHHLVNDVHIMVTNPLLMAPKFVKVGADYVTFHFEACSDEEEIAKTIAAIHDGGAKAGLSIKPNTPVEALLPFIEDLDLVLIMSVEPGKGGQKFIESSLDKISFLRDYIDFHGLKALIEVDGGINAETGAKCVKAGVDILVAGSYLYGHEDFDSRVEGLLNL